MPKRTRTSPHTSAPDEDLAGKCRLYPSDPAHLVSVLGLRDLLPVAGGRDERVAAIAARQRGRVARRQLIAAGLTRHMIEHMLATGQLHPRHHGVYAVGHLAPTELGRETEALLACSRGAVLSHTSAAFLWGLRPEPRGRHPVDVTTRDGTSVSKPGIRCHRSRTLHRRDVRIHRGLPVTSPARALLDNAGTLAEEELEQALDDGLNRNIVRPNQIKDVLERAGHGRRGASLLRRLLAERDSGGRSRSHPERTLRRLLAASDLPQPEMNARILSYDVDFVWPDLRVIVEVDSERYHSGSAKFESDRRRDQRLEAHGWTVIRITARQLRNEPYAVIARLAAALALARARPAPEGRAAA